MIKQIWFDFGNIFIPIYPDHTKEAMLSRGVQLSEKALQQLNESYEVGAITTAEFLQDISFSCKFLQSSIAIKHAWNALLGKLEDHTLFLKKLGREYDLCLVSNTNELHIKTIKKESGPFLWNNFVEKFDALFLSYEIGKRKPDGNYFNHVLQHMDAQPDEVLFIDDSPTNLEAAEVLGLHTWQFNIHEGDLEKELPAVLTKLNQSTTGSLGV